MKKEDTRRHNNIHQNHRGRPKDLRKQIEPSAKATVCSALMRPPFYLVTVREVGFLLPKGKEFVGLEGIENWIGFDFHSYKHLHGKARTS